MADGTARAMRRDGILPNANGWNGLLRGLGQESLGSVRDQLSGREWNGDTWEDRPAPAFAANEEWEHGSVYEPNLIYHDGKWKMWYVAGSNQENCLVHGYAESEDGCGGWSKHF
jgi:hypothetical protein